jgi:predicted transcriptional regulator
MIVNMEVFQMELKKTNKAMMTANFPTIKADAHLKEAYAAIKKNLEGPPHSPGLVVLDQEGKYAGLLTVDDLMKELARLYRHACDKPGKMDWFETFFTQCELVGMKQVSEIMSGRRLSLQADDSFEKSCELVLYKQLTLLAVVDKNSKPVGIITRRKVLVEIAPRMFK